MRNIANNKFIFIIIFFVATVFLFVFLAHREQFFMLFGEGTSLNFQRDDIELIRVRSTGVLTDFDNVTVNDAAKIREIIKYLNSLELVEAELPRNLRTRIRRQEDVGWILIYLGESVHHNPGDVVEFWANYMRFTYHGHKFFGTYTYYVRNSGFCNRTNTSYVYQFLQALLNESA